MIVAKFGGTSVSSKESVLTLCSIVGQELKRQPVVVVSALSGVTDLLLSLTALPKSAVSQKIRELRFLHKNLIQRLWTDQKSRQEILGYVDKQLDEVIRLLQDPEDSEDKAFLDKLSSYGEIISSYIITRALLKRGIKSKQIIATDLIITNDNFTSAEFLLEPTISRTKKIIKSLLKEKITPVVTGFIGSTKDGRVTTLGRGGSDYTAAIIGFCLKAEEIQIWTDVDGIMTADPRLVKRARNVELVSFDEASELAILGAKVLHPKTIFPAIEKNIPVKILNTKNPTHKGTTILNEVTKKQYVTSVACKKHIKLIHIHTPKMFLMYGFLHRVFNVFDKHKISVDFVSTSEISISVTVNGKYDTKALTHELKDLAEVEVREKRATVSVVGRPPRNAPVISGKVYTMLEKKSIDVEMISSGASKINETVVVKEEDADTVVKILHQTFFE